MEAVIENGQLLHEFACSEQTGRGEKNGVEMVLVPEGDNSMKTSNGCLQEITERQGRREYRYDPAFIGLLENWMETLR